MKTWTQFCAGIVLLWSAWTCGGPAQVGTDAGKPEAPGPSPGPQDPNSAPEGTVHPFVPAYGFDLQDLGRAVHKTLSVEISGTLESKHMWHGFDLMAGHSVFLPVATLGFGDTGLSAKAIGVYALDGGPSQRDELDGALFYTRDFLADTRWALHGTLDYFYYGKPRIPSQRGDSQELGLGLAWPKLLGEGGLVPSYYLGRLWPTEHNSLVSGIGGFLHVLGLTYPLAVPQTGTEDHPQIFKLYGDLTYNDGFGGVGHGWSHLTFGTSTDLTVGPVTLTPTLNYQLSLKDSIAPTSGLWGGLTFLYRF